MENILFTLFSRAFQSLFTFVLSCTLSKLTTFTKARQRLNLGVVTGCFCWCPLKFGIRYTPIWDVRHGQLI